MKVVQTIASVICTGLLLISASVFAQNQPMGFITTRVDVKPGANGQFENFIMQFKAAAEETNWPSAWNASQVAVGTTNQYLFISPFNSHQELATPVTAVLARAHSSDEVAEIVVGLRESVANMVTGTYYQRDDMSHPPASPVQNQEVVLSIQVNATPGRELAFEEWLHRVVDASADNITWMAFNKGFGDGPDYVFRIPQTWADLDGPASSPQQRVLNAFGPIAGNAIVNMGANATASRTYQLHVPRPDLSYSP